MEKEMELSSDHQRMTRMEEHNDYDGDQSPSNINPRIKRRSKGGIKTMPFIIANEGLQYVASFGLLPNMTFYLLNEYMMGLASAQNLLFYWSSASNFLPIVGAFVADSYLGRFLVIGLGSIFGTLGSGLLWLTTMIPEVRPPPCDILSSGQTCKSATAAQYAILVSSFILVSIGAGGVRACSLAFGANQFDNPDNPKNKKVMETYFNWYYASANVSILIAITGIVYLQDHIGWKVGFGVPAILMFLSALLFFLASPFYIKQKVTNNLFSRYVQVIVVAFKNRKLAYPHDDNPAGYYQNNKSDAELYLVPSHKLRFINKACIMKNHEDHVGEAAVNPWNLCTVEQVEELKALIRVIPLWSTGIMIGINVSQVSFPLLQAQSMNRHITKSFEIPAGSFPMFMVITVIAWLVLYDRVLLPVASKIKGKPVRIGPKERIGVAIFFSCLSMLVSGFIEHVRRRKAIKQGLLTNPEGVVTMSAMWIVPQYVLGGIAEACSSTSQTEFYYSELPKNMSSLASALFGLGTAVGSLLASVVLSNVDNYTKGENGESWVSRNINKGHYDKYYWLLSIMTVVNFFYFMVCSWEYGPSTENLSKNMVEGEGDLLQENNGPASV